MGILARLRLAKIRTMARPNSPDMPPKRTKEVRLGINIAIVCHFSLNSYYRVFLDSFWLTKSLIQFQTLIRVLVRFLFCFVKNNRRFDEFVSGHLQELNLCGIGWNCRLKNSKIFGKYVNFCVCVLLF